MNLHFFNGNGKHGEKKEPERHMTPAYESTDLKRVKIEKEKLTKEQALKKISKEQDPYLKSIRIAVLNTNKMLDNATTAFLITQFGEETKSPKPSWLVMEAIIEGIFVSETSSDYKFQTLNLFKQEALKMEDHCKGMILLDIQQRLECSCALQEVRRQPPEEE